MRASSGRRCGIPFRAQYGYTFVGEASDGEMALPFIRQKRPDVLITDIRMPFMDGLALSKLVPREFPKTKIIIISGGDGFEYAQQAIGIGVERYLLDIDANFQREDLALNRVSKEVNISANGSCSAPQVCVPGKWRRPSVIGTRITSAFCSRRPKAVRPEITGRERTKDEASSFQSAL